MVRNSVIDATLCPLCREVNQCAVEIEKASGMAQAACWCTKRKIDVTLLNQIPLESRGLACICASCASRSHAPPQTSSTHAKDNHANVPH